MRSDWNKLYLNSWNRSCVPQPAVLAVLAGLAVLLAGVILIPIAGCRRRTDIDRQAAITVYGFSVVKEPLERRIFPHYRREWREKTGQDLTFIPSYAGSEIVTNQIIAGVEADVAVLASARHADRLVESGATRHDWRRLPHQGIVNRTAIVLVVEKGNPHRIREFADLGNRGIRLIHCDPVSSGAGQWSLLAVYGSELLRAADRPDERKRDQALATLQSVWNNVVSTPGSAREARTQFERREGNALVTYELEALQLLEKSSQFEIVVPTTTVIAEHPVVIISHPQQGLSPARYAMVELFVRSLWERPAQEAWVEARFRAVTDDQLNASFTKIQHPFTVADLGGWGPAYQEIVEDVWRRRIQKLRPND